MPDSFHEFVIGGVLIAPIVRYALVALVIAAVLRSVLHRIGFLNHVSSPSIVEFSLYVSVFGLLTLLS